MSKVFRPPGVGSGVGALTTYNFALSWGMGVGAAEKEGIPVLQGHMSLAGPRNLIIPNLASC